MNWILVTFNAIYKLIYLIQHQLKYFYSNNEFNFIPAEAKTTLSAHGYIHFHNIPTCFCFDEITFNPQSIIYKHKIQSY